MRNLKKVLAMALALVMSLSLVTIANAADFSDDADISYKEAVDVMSAIGVINGYEDGSFQPDGILTREEAAKLICTMLLGSGADRLGTTSSSFTDVAATRWSAPYIEYCNSLGIIAGNGDGTFDPTGELTGHAFAKMLLVALGYDSAREGYTGAGWSIEVAKDAITAGIDVDGVAMSAEVTREVAAQMAFNTLEATMVEYATAGTVVTAPDGTTVVTSGSNASKVENNANRAGYDGEKDGYQQFCEEYFDDLEKSTSATDKYSRPAVAWEYDNEDVGTYAKEADASYTEPTEVRDIYSDLGLDATMKAADIDLFVDGESSTGTDYVEGNAIVDITKRGDTEYGAQGAQMDVYYDDEAETVTICIVNTFLGIVTDDDYTQDGDDGILVQVYGDASDSYFVKNAAYEQDTVLLVQVADDEIQAVVGEPETVEGSLTRISNSYEITMDGTKYAVANQFTTADDDVIEGKDTDELDTDEDITYTLYLDQYGNYIAAVVAEDNAQKDMVYIYSAETGTVLDGNKVKYGVIAQIVRMDGTVEELTIGDTYANESGASGALSSLNSAFSGTVAGKLGTLSYDEDDDVYTLSATLDDYTSANVAADIDLSEDDASAKLAGGSARYYLDNGTTYLFITENEDGDGIDEVEVITGGVNYTTTAGVFAHDNRDVAYVVFKDSYTANSDDVIYFGNVKYRGSESNGYVYRGYLLGESDYTDYVIHSVGGTELSKSNVASTTLNGFYKFSERSNGSLKLELITSNNFSASYEDDKDSYLYGTLDGSKDGIRNGILEWGTDDNTALVSNAVVVDLTDADKTSENTYGRNVNSVSTLQRLLDNDTAYKIDISMFVNKDNEVEAIFITKIAGGPSISDGGDEDDTESVYAIQQTSAGPISVTVSGTTLSMNNAKVVDTSKTPAANVNFEEMNVSIVVERQSDASSTGYVSETSLSATVTAQGNSVDAQCQIPGTFTLPYALASGTYRITFTFTGDVVGTMTYQAMATIPSV